MNMNKPGQTINRLINLTIFGLSSLSLSSSLIFLPMIIRKFCINSNKLRNYCSVLNCFISFVFNSLYTSKKPFKINSPLSQRWGFVSKASMCFVGMVLVIVFFGVPRCYHRCWLFHFRFPHTNSNNNSQQMNLIEQAK